MNPIKDPIKDTLVPLRTNFNANGSLRWRTSLYLNFCCYPLFSLDSNISFLYISKGWIQDTLNLHDSCGVNNLHGMPGLLSSFLSVFYCAIASKDTYGDT